MTADRFRFGTILFRFKVSTLVTTHRNVLFILKVAYRLAHPGLFSQREQIPFGKQSLIKTKQSKPKIRIYTLLAAKVKAFQ